MPLNMPAPKKPPIFQDQLGPKTDTALVRAMPAAPRLAIAANMGDSASPAALARLQQAITDLGVLRREAALPILQEALAAMHADRHTEGAELALKALEVDEECGVGWHILAICREKAGDFTNSLKCYESALHFSPDEPEIANDLGRLAIQMGFKDLAEQLFLAYLQMVPDSVAGANNLACAQRDLKHILDLERG